MSNIQIGQNMQSLTVGRKLDSYTGVIIHAGQNSDGGSIDYSAGNATGYVLEIDNPIGTQAMANMILAGLRMRGIRYQPFEAGNAMLDPSAEIGDSITVNGLSSVIFRKMTRHSHLMAADAAAPHDEEVDHEFTFVPRTVREFRRESAYTRARITLNEEQISLEVVRATNAEGVLDSRITLTADSIQAEVSRATAAEGRMSSRITANASEISAEVTRAANAEGSLSSRITQNADAITSEVSARTSADTSLGTRIDQRLDNITLTASSSAGSSTFTIKDGSVEIATKTLDLTVKAANITGKLTVGQLAAGSVVVASQSETEYYLSDSASSATGGSWSSTMPTWSSGKYLWVRQKTTDTLNDNTTTTRYSPTNGRYDKNLTTALSTAAAAQATADGAASNASTANTRALSATARSQLVYRSTSGGSAPSAPSAWVSDATGAQNTWTSKRPEYSSSYPALYIATQKETVGGTVSCTTPLLDATTTVIDGAHIITGTIDASKISVNNLQAISASIAGWTLSSTLIRKLVEKSFDVYMQAPVTPTAGNLAFAVRTYDSSSSSWVNRFYVTYGGTMFANNANISGTITATAGTIGGVTIANGVLSGISDTNIRSGGISGGSGGSIGGDTVTTYNTDGGITTSVGHANFSNGVFSGTNTADYCGAKRITANVNLTAANEFYFQQTPVTWHTQKVVVDSAGTTVTIRYLGN